MVISGGMPQRRDIKPPASMEGMQMDMSGAAIVIAAIKAIAELGLPFWLAGAYSSPEKVAEALEIGCGLGLAGLVAVAAGVRVRFTDYDDDALFDSSGRYGAFDWVSIGTMVVASVLGWGLVVNSFAADASWNNWQGYLLGPLGLGGKEGTWAWANLGVLISLAIGFFGWLLLGRSIVRRQESGQP